MFANNYTARLAAFCLLLCLHLVLPGQICLADTPDTSSGQGSSTGTAAGGQQQPLNLDLSSTTRDISAGAAGTIAIGDGNRTIGVNDLLTPAEHVALLQTLNGGTQSINLGAGGNAVGGNFTVNSQIFSGAVSNLVVPQGVTGVSTLTNMQLSGNLTNYGNLYAVSTNDQNLTATISAANIFNQQGALITTILPTCGLPGITGAIQGLNLTLVALNNIVNAGTISSAGNLTAIADGAIINSLPTNVTGIAPVMQATNNINLVSNIGSIVNSGLINSIAGNINVTSQIANNLIVNNVAGQLQALNGALNVRDALFTNKYDFALFGGNIATTSMNIFSGNGTVNINVKEMDGILNLYAGEAHINANTPNMQLGTLTVTGDPTFYNVGNILLNGDISFPGQDIAIISGSDIISNGAQVINTSSTNLGGSITMMAGATFLTTGADTELPPAGDTTSLVTVTGGTFGGGKIDLSTTPIVSISSVGGFNAGGNITLVAYGGSRVDSGAVTLAPTSTIASGSGGSDINGSITIIAGGSSGTAIKTGTVNTQGVSNGTGNIYMLTSQAALSGCAACTGVLKIVDGTIIEGAFNTDAKQYPTTNANILAGNLSSSGGSIQLLAGGTVNTGTITTSGADATGKNGGIAMLAGANTGIGIQAETLLTSGGLGNSGNIMLITSLPDINTTCNNCPLSGRQANAAGSVVLSNATASGNIDLRVGGDLKANTLTSNGNGLSFGGTVGLQTNNVPGSSNTFVVGGAGSNAVQKIVVQGGSAGGGTIAIVGGSTGGIDASNKTAMTINSTPGQGSAIGINATAGTLVVPGRWNVDGNSQGDGGLIALSGKTINFTTPVRLTANATGSGNGGVISVAGEHLNFPASSAVLQANGLGNQGYGGSIALTSANEINMGTSTSAQAMGSGTGDGGRITMVANGDFNMNNGSASLIVTAQDGQGGLVSLGGSSINIGTGNVSVNAHSDSQLGGAISVTASSITTGVGSLTLTASSGLGAGGNIQLTADNITTGSGTVRLNSNSVSDFGGSINFSATNLTLGTGRLIAQARGGTGGGFISAMVDNVTGQSDMALNADAAGTKAGDGGFISLSTISSAAGLTLGNLGGQINMSADGYSTTDAAANGGAISVVTGGDLILAGPALTVSTSAANGNGGQIDLIAGTGGEGALQLNGNVQANATGSGNGGTINLSYADSDAVTSTGVITARSQSGIGGTITVSNTSATAPSLTFIANGTMSVRSVSGTAGNIIFLSQGDGETPSQDISISGTGALQGQITAVGRNVALNMGTNTALDAATISAIGGNLSVTVGTLSLDSGSTITSSGTLSVSTKSVINNGTISAVEQASFQNSGNLVISGSGSISADSIDFSSNSGLVRAQINSLSGAVSGTAATSFSLTVDTGNLEVNSVTAQAGNLTLASTSGNLTLLENATVLAIQGNIVIQTGSVNGVITFSDGSTVSAIADNGRGQISVLAGGATRQLIAGTAPSGFTANLSAGGRIYYGSTGITNLGTNNVANVTGSRLVFGTGLAPASAIILNSNVTFNAVNQPGVIAQSDTDAQNDENANRIANNEEEATNGYKPVAFVQSAAAISTGAARSAQAAGQGTRSGYTGTAFIKHSAQTAIFTNSAGELFLKKGELFVAANEHTTIKSGACVITLGCGALAQVDNYNGAVKVRNLYDSGKGGITIQLASGHKVTIPLGQELVVIRPGDPLSNPTADRVSRRRVKETKLPDGETVLSSEYSLLSVIKNSEILGTMFVGKNTQEKAFADKMMKMSVCLMTVTSSHGAFTRQQP